ncbi:hypothetical protein NQ314_007218 [Rhamnusium bicolor]|uniref:RNA-directed DNA polymerase n=1 Tax=Rhamnusium bicolor TaxID=1586634 RepID=A0AAV8YQX9_9CUCU|nr:hypothetical protein NQ314_007218 [Rhamnusium bicolor]
MEEMAEHLILGQEWMLAEQATLDFQYNCVYFDTTYRQSAYWHSHRDFIEYAPPIKLTEDNVSEEHCDSYEAVLNEFPDVFHERLRQPTTRLTTHNTKPPEQDGTDYTTDNEATEPWQRTLKNDYTVRDNLIWYTKDNRMALVVPLEFWSRVIHEYHDKIGHPGRDETIDAVRRLYYWPALTKQIKTHVRHCLICASTKRGGTLQPHAPLHPRPPTRPWQVVSFDAMGLTQLHEEKTDTSSSAQTPFQKRIITDNATIFRSLSWQRYLRSHNITGYTAPIYHQRANPVERRNQEIKKALRIQNQDQPIDRWDENLHEITFNLHNRKNAATGMSPSQALLGAQLVKPESEKLASNKHTDEKSFSNENTTQNHETPLCTLEEETKCWSDNSLAPPQPSARPGQALIQLPPSSATMPAPAPMPEQGHLEAPLRLRPIPWPARDTESEADEDDPPTVPV